MVTAMVTVISLVLMISGLVIKNGLLLLASVVSWIIFAFLMYEYTFANTAINTGLLMFGGFMAILCATMAVLVWTSGRPRRAPPEDEQASYKKKVLNATRRR